MNFHFFNVENAQQVRDVGSKPHLTQYGPYAYREVRRKENMTHYGANSLYFRTYFSYTFDQEKTNELNCFNNKNTPCSDQDEIVVLNPIIAMFGQLLPKLMTDICELLPGFLQNGTIANWCPTMISVLEIPIINAINKKLDGTQAAKDDLIFTTTPDELLYTVNYVLMYIAITHILVNVIKYFFDDNIIFISMEIKYLK